MDVSILQHAKDKAPRQMALDEVVELIRGDAWPAGYQPLAVMASVVSGGVMRKHIRWLTGLGIAHISHLTRQEAVTADNHTLLCYADGSGGCYVAYKYEHPDVYYDDAAMPFMSADIDGADKSTEGLRERAPSWAERVMTLDEIDDYLVKHVELRRNVITSRMEIRWFADDIPRGLEPWKEFTDYEFNKLWRRMQRIKDVSERHLHQEIESDFSPDFHPFRDYLEHLPPWDGKADHIAILAAGVTVEGGEREQQSFCNCLKRWLVAMIAGWLTEDVVNQTVLVFIGYGLIACEELDSMTKGEMNSLKADITTAIFSYRPPYGRYMENHKHIASFCATGNHPKFLNDPTGTRRWLPFKVESILSPWDFPFDHDNIFAQAYALWQGGYQYYFSDVEIEWLNDRNSRFAVANLEKQLVFRYFRKPTENESGELVDTAMALQVISYNVGPKIYPDKVDAAFADLGFEEKTVNGMSGYLAVRRKPEEIEALARLMAQDAKQQPPKT